MAKKKQNWNSGDIFAVPLGDGSFSLGQVISHEQHCMDSVLCAYASTLTSDINTITWLPKIEDIISIQITSRDSLDKHIWRVVSHSEPLNLDASFDIKSLREKRYVGASIKGSGAMNKLLSAYHGLSYWDIYFDPEYFDKLLLAGVKRPENVLLRGQPLRL